MFKGKSPRGMERPTLVKLQPFGSLTLEAFFFCAIEIPEKAKKQMMVKSDFIISFLLSPISGPSWLVVRCGSSHLNKKETKKA